MNEQTIAEIRDCLLKLHSEAEKAFGRTFRKPSFDFNLSGQSAGRATYSAWRISINPVLYAENKADYLESTLPHEWAHLVAFEVFKETGHGNKWWWTMGRLNIKSERCHDYNIANVKKGNNPIRPFSL